MQSGLRRELNEVTTQLKRYLDKMHKYRANSDKLSE